MSISNTESSPELMKKNAFSDDDNSIGINLQIRSLAMLLYLFAAITLALLYWSAKEQDKITITSSHQLAKTALEIEQRHLGSTVTDYTFWTEAYNNTVKDFDIDWYQSDLIDYPYLTDAFGITIAILAAPGNVIKMYSTQEGIDLLPENTLLSEINAKGLVELVETARSFEEGEFPTISSFIKLDDQIYIAAAHVIHPSDDDQIKIMSEKPKETTLLILMKPLDDNLVEHLSSNFGFDNLIYTQNSMKSLRGNNTIKTIGGETLGFLRWNITLPSSQIFTVVLPPLVMVLLMIILLAWYIMGIIRRGQGSLYEAMQEAISANNAKNEFLAVMSHELRTPMNGVLGFAAILKNKNLDDTTRELLSNLITCADDLLLLINDLFDMTLIEKGRIELAEEVYNPQSIVDNAVSMIRAQVEAKGLELQAELSDSTNIDVIGDSGRFKQVVLNLLGNAIKFTDEGIIKVKLESQNRGNYENINLTVEDSGIGISKENQSLIFDRFAQVDTSTTRRAQGAGLGLAICKAIIDAMDGKFDMKSKLGEGSKFRVSVTLLHAKAKGVS